MGVRIASPNPACCSACYGASGGRHVDFEAATDGPVVLNADGSPVAWEGGLVSVEDIILCEACVRAGAELLSLVPAVMEGLAQELRDAHARARVWQERAVALAMAAAAWPAGTDLDLALDVDGASSPGPRLKLRKEAMAGA